MEAAIVEFLGVATFGLRIWLVVYVISLVLALFAAVVAARRR